MLLYSKNVNKKLVDQLIETVAVLGQCAVLEARPFKGS